MCAATMLLQLSYWCRSVESFLKPRTHTNPSLKHRTIKAKALAPKPQALQSLHTYIVEQFYARKLRCKAPGSFWKSTGLA